ncbi:hypothetical protein VNO78_26902 [Psophocarpus tetragonolobus]|uniref:Uncharacterized protein n=1 Tax=Psophocarpus tetragonolobus TaxID=3891 RepID=A0AAN9RZV0_PSOTE
MRCKGVRQEQGGNFKGKGEGEETVMALHREEETVRKLVENKRVFGYMKLIKQQQKKDPLDLALVLPFGVSPESSLPAIKLLVPGDSGAKTTDSAGEWWSQLEPNGQEGLQHLVLYSEIATYAACRLDIPFKRQRIIDELPQHLQS